jgi:hypothetical protein
MGFLELSSAWLSYEQPAGVSIEMNRKVDGGSRIVSSHPAIFRREQWMRALTDEKFGPIRPGLIVVPMGRKGGDYSVVAMI